MENTAEGKTKPEEPDVPSTKEGLFNRSYVHLIIIALLGLLAYSNTFHVPFQFDDIGNIAENPLIKDMDYFKKPLSSGNLTMPEAVALNWKSRIIGYLTFALNYKVHGLDVVGYHIVNLLIHIINAVLVYLLVLLTFRTPFLKTQNTEAGIQNDTVHISRFTIHSSLFIALFAALLFVSHPIQTQAVTYIVQRVTSLATLFYLLSLVMYIKARLTSTSTLTFYFLSLISAVLAMKTKEIAFTLPLVIALYEFMFFEGKIKKRLLYLLPLLLTMLIIPVSLIGLDKPIGDLIGDVSEATKVQAGISRWDYLFTQFRVIVTYIRLIFLPINQNLDYDYPIYRTFFDLEIVLSFLFLLSVFGLGIYLFRRYRHNVPHTRLISFGVFWFFIALAVESSIIPLHVIFEHRVYLPSAGALLALSSGAFMGLNRLENKKVRAIGIVFLILLPIVLSAAAYKRNSVWKSDVSLWEDVVRKSPEKARGHNNLGKAYRAEGMTDEAIKHYKIALRFKPDFVDVHYNLGSLYGQEGLMEKAIEHLQTALRLNPDISMAHNNLGNVYYLSGKVDQAIIHFRTAIELQPDNLQAHYNLGLAYQKKGLPDKAQEHFRIAESLKKQKR